MSSSAIEQAAGAVVGTIVAKASIPPLYEDQERFVVQVQVSADLKDNLADQIYLTSEEDDGGNCGVSWQIGTQIAAAIYESDGELRSDGCSEIPPPLADTWQPAVTVGGAATLLIGGEQPNRLVAYDQSGTPIAFAFDAGAVRFFSVCPGAEVVVELVNQPDNSSSIDTRSLTTFEVTSSVPASNDDGPLRLWGVRCDSPDGSQATTDGYVLADGVFTASDETFAYESNEPERFWPQLETDNAAAIRGESWMTQATSFEEPVDIDATGRFAPVQQLGQGVSFADQIIPTDDPSTSPTSSAPSSSTQSNSTQSDQAQSELAQSGTAQSNQESTNNTLVWVGIPLLAALLVAAAVALSRRNLGP